MKPILAGSYMSDANNPIKTPWGLTSDNSKVNYKMIDLNSTDSSLDQLKQLNNQMIFDEDRSEKIKKAIKGLNDPLPEDAYSVDELVEYKKWYNQAAKNKLQISQTCKDWFEGIFALLIPFGVDYYKTKYRDTSLYNIKPVQFSIDILKEIAGFVDYFDLDVNTIIYSNLLIRINQKEMTKLKEANTYTLEELKWYKFWYDDGLGVYKPSLNSKFKEALDEESKTEIVFDLDDLKLIKSCADNYYEYHVRDDYKMSIEEDNILDKLDARISFLRKKNIHQHTKDVFNSPIKSSVEDEETVSNAYVKEQEEIWAENHIWIYTISDIYWIDKWCEDRIKITESISIKLQDIGREIFKSTGKLPEAASDNSIDNSIASVYVFFSLKELKEIRNYASIYYSSSEKTVGAKNTLDDINLRIKYLEKQSEKILNVFKSGCRESYQLTHEFHTYTKADIFWYAEWALDNCKILYPVLYKKIIKGLKLTKESDETYQYYFFKLHELQNIRWYTLSYYHTLNHDQPDKERSIEESIVLCRLDEKIEFIKEWEDTKLKIYLEGEKRMKNKIESENNTCDRSLQPITAAERISCKCDYIACNICNNEKELAYIIKECIKQQYNVNYKCDDVNTFKGYITHGELISYVETDETKFYITIHTPADEGNLTINMLSEIDLKTIKFENNTLYIQGRND